MLGFRLGSWTSGPMNALSNFYLFIGITSNTRDVCGIYICELRKLIYFNVKGFYQLSESEQNLKRDVPKSFSSKTKTNLGIGREELGIDFVNKTDAYLRLLEV